MTPPHVRALAFDAVIALVVAAVPLYFVELRYRWKTLPSRELHVLVVPIVFAAWAVVLYGSFIEPRMLVTRTATAAIGPGEREIRIALVSDTHLGGYRFQDHAARVTRKIMALRPDAIIMLGDLASTERGSRMFAPFAALEAPLGVYAVLGNWDYGAGAVDVRTRIESQGVEVLTNEAYRLDAAGGPLWLAGIDDVWFGDPDIDLALAGIPAGDTVILATHNPDIASVAEARGVDLMLAGHTHGGQVRLPGVGAVPPLPTKIGRRFDEGLFEIGPMAMYITSGAGESGPRARLFNPPEIVLLNVTY